jgi:alpha-1,3-rhamnosyl/mannosyltransferase
LQKGLEDEPWRTTAVEQGLQHAAGFSWERCAMETLQVYHRVLEGQ